MLVGKDISNNSCPKSIKMKNGTSNGTLILSVKRGNEINIEYSKTEIINKINSYFGYKLINEIKLKTNNYENKNKKKNITERFSKNFKEKINIIKNKTIKDSLSDLLKAIKND